MAGPPRGSLNRSSKAERFSLVTQADSPNSITPLILATQATGRRTQSARKILDEGPVAPLPSRVRLWDSVFVTDEVSPAADHPVPSENGDEGGVLAHLRQFFRGHFVGDPDAEARTYAEVLGRGGAIVKIELDADANVEKACRALEAAGAVDIDERKGGVRVYPRAAANSKNKEGDSRGADTRHEGQRRPDD